MRERELISRVCTSSVQRSKSSAGGTRQTRNVRTTCMRHTVGFPPSSFHAAFSLCAFSRWFLPRCAHTRNRARRLTNNISCILIRCAIDNIFNLSRRICACVFVCSSLCMCQSLAGCATSPGWPADFWYCFCYCRLLTVGRQSRSHTNQFASLRFSCVWRFGHLIETSNKIKFCASFCRQREL